MALLQLLLDQHPGPLPIKGTFQCLSSDALDFIVNGVSVRKYGSPNGPAGIEIVITDSDGKQVGWTSGTIDGSVTGGRRSVISQFGQSSLKPGKTYNFVVQGISAEVASDKDDFFTATIIY